jgi:hypothetical protein
MLTPQSLHRRPAGGARAGAVAVDRIPSTVGRTLDCVGARGPLKGKSGRQGTSLGGGLEKSPARRKREAARRRREEKRWARKSGPVTSRQMTAEERERYGLPPLDDSAAG